MTGAWECPTCADDERYAPGTYCAPARCLCGHPECHAYPSWTPIRHLAAVPNPTRFTVPPRPEPYDHDDYMENR